MCAQNSARSQMAEGFLRHHAGDHFEAYSAGCTPTEKIHPYAIEVMDEVGIDIRHQSNLAIKSATHEWNWRGREIGRPGLHQPYTYAVCELARVW